MEPVALDPNPPDLARVAVQMKAARHGLRILCSVGGQSKMAGSLRGTLRASTRIVSTLARVATAGSRP